MSLEKVLLPQDIEKSPVSKRLLLFLDFLPLFAVDGISAADMLVGTGLNHASQSPEQTEHCGGGLPVDMVLYLFQQSGSVFIAMAGGRFQPLYYNVCFFIRF